MIYSFFKSWNIPSPDSSGQSGWLSHSVLPNHSTLSVEYFAYILELSVYLALFTQQWDPLRYRLWLHFHIPPPLFLDPPSLRIMEQSQSSGVCIACSPRCADLNKFSFWKCFSFLFLKCIYLALLGLTCDMWYLVPWPGIEPGIPGLGVWSLATGPPGKSLKMLSWKYNFPLRSCTKVVSDFWGFCFLT